MFFRFPLSYVPLYEAEFEKILSDQYKVVLKNINISTDNLSDKDAETLLRNLDETLATDLDNLIAKARVYYPLFSQPGNSEAKDIADEELYEALEVVKKSVQTYWDKNYPQNG